MAERAAKQKKDLGLKRWEAKVRNSPGERFTLRKTKGNNN
jgi:hypothetical protein